MAVHVEVPGDFGQGELDAVQLPRENDLTSQPGVLLKQGRHVEHVVLPESGDVCQRLTSSHVRRISSTLPLIRLWQLVQMSSAHVDVARGAGQRRLAGA